MLTRQYIDRPYNSRDGCMCTLFYVAKWPILKLTTWPKQLLFSCHQININIFWNKPHPTGQNIYKFYSSRDGCICASEFLFHVAKRPILKLKTWLKHLLFTCQQNNINIFLNKLQPTGQTIDKFYSSGGGCVCA